MGAFFDLILIDPLTNLFVFLNVISGAPVMAIILLTVIIRLVTLPLTLKQMHSTRAMAAVAPRMQDIQKRFKDPKRRSQEQMKLYKEAGINPIGCFSGMLIQMPILFALYATFRLALGDSPEALVALSDRLYPWDYLRNGLPIEEDFLWFNLGQPETLFIPLTVGISTYLLQKMSALPAMDERQAAQNSMMNILMPMIFAWITITLPSGLGLYYVLSNIIGIVLQYAYIGGGPINWRAIIGLSKEPVLPRALEVRQAQLERFAKNDEAAFEEEDAGEEKAIPAGTSRKRRRYASGRRRGRR